MSRVAKKRLVAVRTVQALVSAGEPLGDACFDAGISVAQFRRWSRRIDAAVLEALKDAPRPGRRCEHRPQDRGRHTEVPAHDKTHGVPWAHGGSGVHAAHRT